MGRVQRAAGPVLDLRGWPPGGGARRELRCALASEAVIGKVDEGRALRDAASAHNARRLEWRARAGVAQLVRATES